MVFNKKIFLLILSITNCLLSSDVPSKPGTSAGAQAAYDNSQQKSIKVQCADGAVVARFLAARSQVIKDATEAASSEETTCNMGKVDDIERLDRLLDPNINDDLSDLYIDQLVRLANLSDFFNLQNFEKILAKLMNALVNVHASQRDYVLKNLNPNLLPFLLEQVKVKYGPDLVVNNKNIRYKKYEFPTNSQNSQFTWNSDYIKIDDLQSCLHFYNLNTGKLYVVDRSPLLNFSTGHVRDFYIDDDCCCFLDSCHNNLHKINSHAQSYTKTDDSTIITSFRVKDNKIFAIDEKKDGAALVVLDLSTLDVLKSIKIPKFNSLILIDSVNDEIVTIRYWSALPSANHIFYNVNLVTGEITQILDCLELIRKSDSSATSIPCCLLADDNRKAIIQYRGTNSAGTRYDGGCTDRYGYIIVEYDLVEQKKINDIGEQIIHYWGNLNPVKGMAVSPNGKLLALFIQSSPDESDLSPKPKYPFTIYLLNLRNNTYLSKSLESRLLALSLSNNKLAFATPDHLYAGELLPDISDTALEKLYLDGDKPDSDFDKFLKDKDIDKRACCTLL